MAQDQALSQRIRKDYRQASLTAKDRAMLDYTDKLVRDRLSVGVADHEALRRVGFSNADIFDITLVVANFMLANTLTDAFGLEYHENLHHVFVDEAALAESSGVAAFSLATLLPGDEIWLNAPTPVAVSSPGRPLLVYTWDWTHPDSVDGLGYLAAWQHRYVSLGLAVLSVLAPEFPFAKEPDAARRAIQRLGVTASTALVPSYRTWRGANNTFWPAWHLVDGTGTVRGRHHGPGGYAAIEQTIQAVLRETGHVVAADLEEPIAPRHRAGVMVFAPTPPLYAVYDKGRLAQPELAAAEGRVVDLTMPQVRLPGALYASGRWLVRPDGLELAEGAGSLVVSYRGAGVAAVLGHSGTGAIVDVRLDDRPPGEAAGRDARSGTVDVAVPGLFELLDGPFGEHVLRLETVSPGFRVHAMTFLSAPATAPGPWPTRMVE
jgi:hypothetical protein